MQTAYIKDNVIFDVYYFYEGITEGKLVNVNEHGVIEMPEKFSLTQPFVYRNKSIPIPGDIEEYLVWIFGADWITPKTKKEPWEADATHLIKWS
jgi:hypothetical protein